MSNYPPYQYQPPYPGQMGPYMPSQPYPNRMDIQPTPPTQAAQNGPQGPAGGIMGLSPASRPVTSKEEAMGVAADFSGALMMFPDVTHDRVYIKRWDLASGGPAFSEYAPVVQSNAKQETAAPQENPTWATLQQLQDLQDLVDSLKGEIDGLKKPGGKAAVKNDTNK